MSGPSQIPYVRQPHQPVLASQISRASSFTDVHTIRPNPPPDSLPARHKILFAQDPQGKKAARAHQVRKGKVEPTDSRQASHLPLSPHRHPLFWIRSSGQANEVAERAHLISTQTYRIATGSRNRLQITLAMTADNPTGSLATPGGISDPALIKLVAFRTGENLDC